MLQDFLNTLNLVKCACGNIMDVIEGELDRNNKDSEGKALSEDALLHFCKYRVRCNQCTHNFCSKCTTEPYHLGHTCESHNDHSTAEKCRFC